MTITIKSQDDLQNYFLKANELHQSGKIKDALDIYVELLKYVPDIGLLHFNTAHAYLDLDKKTDALFHYEKAYSLLPDDEDVQFNLAHCYKQNRKIELAINIYSEIVSKTPNSIEALYNLANCYKDSQDFDKAIETYQKALKIDKSHLSSINNLAFLYQKVGLNENAIHCYKLLLENDSDNVSAQYMIDALEGKELTSAPNEYVQSVFDSFSEHYEKSLVNELKYTVPSQLKELLLTNSNQEIRYGRCLDLGCGSGLSSQEFTDICNNFTGVDLSEKMLAIASDKNIYNKLYASDIESFLAENKDMYDLIIASDVFTYIGALDGILDKLPSSLDEDGTLLFSVEACQEDFNLQPTGRFAHSKDYITSIANKNKLKLIDCRKSNLRKERGEWINGLIFCFKKLS